MSSTTVPNPANGSFPSRFCRLRTGWAGAPCIITTVSKVVPARKGSFPMRQCRIVEEFHSVKNSNCQRRIGLWWLWLNSRQGKDDIITDYKAICCKGAGYSFHFIGASKRSSTITRACWLVVNAAAHLFEYYDNDNIFGAINMLPTIPSSTPFTPE